MITYIAAYIMSNIMTNLTSIRLITIEEPYMGIEIKYLAD